MAVKVAINGFGRIGRLAFRVMFGNPEFDIVAINDLTSAGDLAYLLKYDSLYGRLNEDVDSNESGIVVNGKTVYVYHEKNIDNVPWEKHGVSKIIDTSGVRDNLTKAPTLKKRIRHLIITYSPEEDLVDKTVIMGINENEIK